MPWPGAAPPTGRGGRIPSLNTGLFSFIILPMPENQSCHHCAPASKNISISKNLKITSAIFIAVFLISFMPQLSALNESLISYIKMIWWAVLLGFLIGGSIEYFIPESFIYEHLGQKKKRTIITATLIGFLMSACSHGILAISMQLYKKGASIPAVIAFLLASPWANLPVTILLFGFFGWKAFVFIGSAMLIAVITGFIFIWLEKTGLIERSKEVDLKEDRGWRPLSSLKLNEVVPGVLKGAWNLADMLLWWLLVGLMIAAFIGAFVPSHVFSHYLGPTIPGLLLTLLFATVIEVCSEGSAPVAFEIFRKTGTMGNPFVFLMAGVATDYTEIGLIWATIGKRTAIWLPIVTVPQIILFGVLFNIFLK